MSRSRGRFKILLLLPVLTFAQSYVFGPSIRVNDDSPGTSFHSTRNSGQHCIGCRGDTVYLVWRDDRISPTSVYFSKSTDRGNTWSSNLRISESGVPSYWPGLALDGAGNIFVSFDGASSISDVYFTKSTDGGRSFTRPIIVNDITINRQDAPSIAVDSSGQKVFIAWQDTREVTLGDDIYLARSTNGGATFLPAVRVVDDSVLDNPQWFPSLSVNQTGDSVYVAWCDKRDTTHYTDVYFARSTNSGNSFQTNILVNDTVGTGRTTQWTPSIFYKNGIIYLVFDDRHDSYCIYFDKSTDGGLTFGQDRRVPDNISAYGTHPSVVVDDSDRIYVAWSDFRDYGRYGHEIYFSYSTDGGNTFSRNVLVNDHQGVITAWDWNPNVCVNEEGGVYVAWDSDRNDPSHSNSDIYTAAGQLSVINEFYERKVKKVIWSAYPNPFRNVVSFELSNTYLRIDDLSIEIYDCLGQRLKNIKLYKTGKALWDGLDCNGRQVPAGVYVCRLLTGKKGLGEVKIVKVK